MKNILNKALKAFAILLLVGTSYTALAQGPPPPPQEGNNGGSQSEKLNGGGAPSGSGLLLLTSLGIAYGVRKWYIYKLKPAKVEA